MRNFCGFCFYRLYGKTMIVREGECCYGIDFHQHCKQEVQWEIIKLFKFIFSVKETLLGRSSQIPGWSPGKISI